MRIGPFRHRIAIQANTPTRNAIGEAVPSWSTIATVWGLVEPLTGRELEIARQVNATSSIRVTMRWPGTLLGGGNSVAPTHRLVYTPGSPAGASSRTFDINNVSNVEERNKTVVCICTEAA